MAEELVRIQNACCDYGRGWRLKDYNLVILSGQIVYIQGVSGSGKSILEDILLGKTIMQSGSIYINEEKCLKYSPDLAHANGIYSTGKSNQLVQGLSILDNLEGIRRMPAFSIFREEQARRQVAQTLQELSISESPDTPVEELTFQNQELLRIAKSVMSGARLLILNCVHSLYSAADVEVLSRYILMWKKRGISFLIIAESPHPFLSIADKIQLISHGTDMFEWNNAAESIDSLYYHHNLSPDSQQNRNPLPASLPDILWFVETSPELIPPRLYLQMLKYDNPDFWKTRMSFSIPDADLIYDGKTVLVPHNSASLLLENLNLEENLSLCIKDRIGMGHLGVINQSMRTVMANDFRKDMHLSSDIQEIWQLNGLQRKILSVYRWVLAHPETIILSNPFWGMDVFETVEFSRYLRTIQKKGIRVILFSRYKDELADSYDQVIYTSYGQITK